MDFVLVIQSSLLPPAALPSAILTLMYSPYQRGIYCDDKSISYPYRRDTISHGSMAAVTLTCSIVIVSPNILSGLSCISAQIVTKSNFFTILPENRLFYTLYRSPQERPTLCTQSVCTPTPSSTSTCQLFTRLWAPSFLEEPSAHH